MGVVDSFDSGKWLRGIYVGPRPLDYFARVAERRARVVLSSGGLEPVGFRARREGSPRFSKLAPGRRNVLKNQGESVAQAHLRELITSARSFIESALWAPRPGSSEHIVGSALRQPRIRLFGCSQSARCETGPRPARAHERLNCPPVSGPQANRSGPNF